MTSRIFFALLATACLAVDRLPAAEVGRGATFSVTEISFRGPEQAPRDTPARDIELRVTFRHESGAEHAIYGFHDGGSDFKVRFCPTRPGRWEIARIKSNTQGLSGPGTGDHVTAEKSTQRGFWEVDADSPGRRWYRRSDGSHQYVIGNTQYSFLSGMKDDGPSGGDIVRDIAANAAFFKKLRFSFTGDRYPHPTEKPFLDDAGRPTDSGDHSHRPNPKWFRERVDLAVKTAYEHDLIADLILAGPDTEDSRSPLRAAANGGDATPYLRYVAARYGSFPNVWICLSNEYEIRQPRWNPDAIAAFGTAIRKYLPYATPLSVHASEHPDRGPTTPEEPAWATQFDSLPPWNDHQIIQRKLRSLSRSADAIQRTWHFPGSAARNKPTVNDELSYQGEGDRHSEGDTLESHLGAFLGGGYASTGEKRANKKGQYFWGNFTPDEHSSARGLALLRQTIDTGISFWKMAPDTAAFPDLDLDFRAMAWPGREYVLGTNKAAQVVAVLPDGTWAVSRTDLIARTTTVQNPAARGRHLFETPASRAVLYHFRRQGD